MSKISNRPKNFIQNSIETISQSIKAKGKKYWLGASAVLLAFIFVCIFCFLQLIVSLNTITGNKAVAMSSEDMVYVKITPGMTADDVGNMLEEAEVIDYKLYFWLLAKLNAVDNRLKVGTYKLEKHMSTKDALEVILSGRSAVLAFTIPEGFTVNEIASRLDKEGIVSAEEFRKAAKDYASMKYMEINDPRVIYKAEGFLFPDTYEVEPDVSAREIVEMMVQNFDDKLSSEIRNKAAEKGLTIRELVNLASLVEKEALYEEDRAQIAQVFYKRLNISMPLQSDASLQYLMDAPKEDVSIADTEIESPYNTYQNYGLPPGPIANPGLKSINAVLYPAQTDYLYFVADRQGHNHYTTNYADHLAIVAKVR